MITIPSKHPKAIFRIPSRSDMGTYYLIELYSDGKLSCSCPAGSFNRHCWHKGRIKEYIQTEATQYIDLLKDN